MGHLDSTLGRAQPGALPRLPVVDRISYLLDAVRDRSMLSIGLGGYPDHRSYSFALGSTDLQRTVSGRLAASAASATFADLSAPAIEAFAPTVDAAYHEVDITTPASTWPAGLRGSRFDVVVVGEVLEHLDNPGGALRNLLPLLAPGGRLIVTGAERLLGLIRALASSWGESPPTAG